MASSTTLPLPAQENNVSLKFGSRVVSLTNLNKVFWPELGITKGALVQYYANVSLYLLPHLKGRTMVVSWLTEAEE